MSRPRLALGIDAGGRAARWQLAGPGGARVAEGESAAFNGHIFTDAARTATFAALARLAETVLAAGRPGAVVAGITGLDADTPEAGAFGSELARLFDLSVARVAVLNDMRIAYEAAFGGPGQGILVYSGTGSIGCHVDREGRLIRVGGRGVMLDDGGSGFWIGKEALRRLFRAEDRAPGSGFASPLGRHLAGAIGGPTWDAARTFVYGGDRGRVGMLAMAVADAARESDAVALDVLASAGRELAELALALTARIGTRDLVLAGGATELHPVVAAAFRAALPHDTVVRHTAITPVDAAAAMAARLLE
jgi:N-acetylglucosamine kinase-like BadF-type ATPase